MKKFALSFLVLLSLFSFSFAQNSFPPSGSVGIGTTSPGQLLDVTGAGSSAYGTAYFNSIFEQDHTNYRGVYLGYDNSAQIGIVAGSSNAAASNLAFWNNNGSRWFEAMRITSAGYVGIGTTAPTQSLTVNGYILGADIGFLNSNFYAGPGLGNFGSASFTGGNNVFLGLTSGNALTTGSNNTILGFFVANNLTTGYRNILIGTQNTSVNTKTAQNLSTGSDNVLIGAGSGAALSSGIQNVGIGTSALSGAFGSYNTAMGFQAGNDGAGGSGTNNSFFGYQSGVNGTTGSYNVFIGNHSGGVNTTGSYLTFLGSSAGSTGTTDGLTNATAIGYNAQVTASNSVILGNGANVGIGTTAPTNALTMGSAATTGLAQYNTADQITNYERLVAQYQSNVFTIGSYYGGSGLGRSLSFGVQTAAGVNTIGGNVFTLNQSAAVTGGIYNFSETASAAGSIMTLNTSLSGAGVQQNMLAVQGTVAQTGASGYTGLLIAPFESSVGTGNKYLIDAGTNSSSGGSGTHTSYLLLTDNGNVGIGTTDNSNWQLATSVYKLAVGGSMIATAVTVKTAPNWPDYVFNYKYNLLPLTDLKAYIDKNHHLPEIPSEKEIEKNGLDLGEMNKLLTKKVEELTLYMIESDKRSKKQEEKIDRLENAVNELLKKQTPAN